jgi:hypothetical protein
MVRTSSRNEFDARPFAFTSCLLEPHSSRGRAGIAADCANHNTGKKLSYGSATGRGPVALATLEL